MKAEEGVNYNPWQIKWYLLIPGVLQSLQTSYASILVTSDLELLSHFFPNL